MTARPRPTTPRTVYFVPHTHWDREWYLPFQVFRARLVDVIDKVLDLLEHDPGYRRFTLDGQAVVLDDYLDVRPERADAIAAQVRAGRLRIGPWYVLADEFLVSPEALIRNLALGHEVCRRFGEPMGVGYTPDSFGHISQLPLIVRGFGLDSIVFERGVGDEGERLRGEFHWLSADGSERVFAVHLLGTYSPAAGIGHIDWELRDTYEPQRAQRQLEAVLYADVDLGEEFPAWLRESVERVNGGIDAYATGRALLMLNGSDHLFPQPNVPEIVRDLNATLDHIDVVHADLEEFVRAAQAQHAELETHRGEFRGSRYQHVLAGVLSARMYLKQANHRAETLLERYAEPLTALAHLAGGADPRPLLRSAWRTLLLNHPHDSICGCSVDPVHREMLTRFDQVEQLGADLCRRAVEHLAHRRDDPRDDHVGTTHLAMFNPLPIAGSGLVRTELLLPAGRATSLRVLDASGRSLPLQLTTSRVSSAGRTDFALERVDLTVQGDLPPLGVGTLRIDTDPAGAITPLAPTDPVRSEEHGDGVTLEHTTLRLELSASGSATLVDRASGVSYPLELCFEDVGDAGDEYDFSPIDGDEGTRVATSLDAPRLSERGPLRASATATYRLHLPERLSDDRTQRLGNSTIDLEVTFTLCAQAHRVDLSVALENHASDHRLRLRVASGRHSDHVWADGHFDVLRRPLRPGAGRDWFQRPVATNHQRRFVAVDDAHGGLAVLNRGLSEYEAIPTPAGVDLAVTLLRCVGWLSREDLITRPQGAGPALATPEAQCHGAHRFELALVPYRGAWWDGPLALEAQRFVAPPRLQPSGGAVQAAGLTLTPPLTLSSFAPARVAGRGAIVRVWNPAAVPVRGRLVPGFALREAHTVRLDETRLARHDLTHGGLDLHLEPSGVVTLELVAAEPIATSDRLGPPTT